MPMLEQSSQGMGYDESLSSDSYANCWRWDGTGVESFYGLLDSMAMGFKRVFFWLVLDKRWRKYDKIRSELAVNAINHFNQETRLRFGLVMHSSFRCLSIHYLI